MSIRAVDDGAGQAGSGGIRPPKDAHRTPADPAGPSLDSVSAPASGGASAVAPVSAVGAESVVTAAASVEAARGDEHVEAGVAYDAILLA